MDMCTMFMGSFVSSADLDVSIRHYLLKYLPIAYFDDGHLNAFTDYSADNFTFLLGSTVDRHDENVNVNDRNDKSRLKYVSIDWKRPSSEIIDDIRREFQMAENCSVTTTFYVTFPSYPNTHLLTEFFRHFETNIDHNSVPIDPIANDPHYRSYVDQSFLSFVDLVPLSVFQQLIQQHSNLRFVFCGHGFGGSIAQLSTLHLVSKKANLHFTQVRSVTLAPLFFAREPIADFIDQRHLDKYFLSIYHEMDVIPSLFKTAALFSTFLTSVEQQQKGFHSFSLIPSWFPSWFQFGKDSLKTHRNYLRNLVIWLCNRLKDQYPAVPSQLCDSTLVDHTLTYLIDALNSISAMDTAISSIVYQPVGTYNLIRYVQNARTWHLVPLLNRTELNEHRQAILSRAQKMQQPFESHSISFYMRDLQLCHYHQSTTTNNNESSKIILPFRFHRDQHDSSRAGMRYMNMIAIPPWSSFNSVDDNFLSTIKHRTGLTKLDRQDTKQIDYTSVYDACLSVYRRYGMDTRMELMKLQLDQRMLVPILVSNPKKHSTPFRSYIKTLGLVETTVLNFDEHRMAFDTKFLRVGLISTIRSRIGGLPEFLQNVFHVQSMRQSTVRAGSQTKPCTIVETGYGFLPDPNSVQFYQPVLVTHVIGSYEALVSFLVDIVDVLIVEINDDDTKNFDTFQYNDRLGSLRYQTILQWKHTMHADYDEMHPIDHPFPTVIFEGNPKAVTHAFQKYLSALSQTKVYLRSANTFRPRLIDIVTDENLLIDDNIEVVDVDRLFRTVNTTDVKIMGFQLQQSYKRQADAQKQIDDLKLQLHDGHHKKYTKIIADEQDRRSNEHKKIVNIPLLQSYLSIITDDNDEQRYVRKRQFEFGLSERNEQTISVLRNERDRTFIIMTQANQDEQAARLHYQAKQNLIAASLNIEHFWREISHLFTSNMTHYQMYPELAAQHLIDGFPLELLDGDTMLLNLPWLEHVFDSLTIKLYDELNRQARVLVLSICGPQSSGKSFLLKTMFGIRIRSSVGACTQGVNMMLVKVLYQDYDYIILLDTEGIRAPEFRFLPDADTRDNTLATFAVLPADGTILLNKGEVNQALEEVLPIVLYVFASSSLSMKNGGLIPSKMFFVYNQIDPGQSGKGTELLQDLTTRLNNITNSIRVGMALKNVTFHGFEQCRLDLTNRSNSDFRILSTNTNNPPLNHPVDLFGDDALRLRQWIEQRINNKSAEIPWQSRTLSEVFEYMKVIGDILRKASHIASVTTALEMLANNKLNDLIENIKYDLSLNFTSVRERMENQLIANYTNDTSIMLTSENIETIIENGERLILDEIQEHLLNAQEKVFKLIQGSKREPFLTDDWQLFIKEKKSRNLKFLGSKLRRVITKSLFQRDVEEKIRRDLIEKCNQIVCINLTPAEHEKVFDEILQLRTKEFLEADGAQAIDLDNEIRRVYNRSLVIGNVRIFSDEKSFCNDNGEFTRQEEYWPINDGVKYTYKSSAHTDVSREETRKYTEAFDETKPYIKNAISNYKLYEPLIVNDVLQHIQRILKDRSIMRIDTIEDVHRATFCTLSFQLIHLQRTWDDDHNRTKLLQDKRENLKTFFTVVAKGIRGMKLFESDLVDKLNSSWRNGFRELLIRDLTTKVSQQAWISNIRILTAYIDNEKMNILEKDGIQQLMIDISSGSTFYEKCMKKFVDVHVQNYTRDNWERFYNNTINTIDRAGEAVKECHNGCLNVFLQTLRNGSLPSAIRDELPSSMDIYGNTTDQSGNVFDSVVNKSKEVIPKEPKSIVDGKESQMILEKIQEDAPNDDAKPRCNQACRLCGAPCRKHVGHAGFHDFHHQPSGLVGVKWNSIRKIVYETCHDQHEKGALFRLGETDNFTPYTEFPNKLGYEIPHTEAKRSLLGEFLMKNYHKEISEFYNIKPNDDIPNTYSHTKEYVKQRIQQAMNENS